MNKCRILQALAKLFDPVATVDDPVVEIVNEKKRCTPTLSEAALKCDKLQEEKKLKPVVVRRTSNRNSKNYDLIIILLIFNFYIFLCGLVN
jgi:hypothetical protein